MPKLVMCSAKKLMKKLIRAGFVESHQRGSHRYFVHWKNGHIACVPTHGGSGDVPVGTLYNIVVRQAGLSAEEFNAL
jgi:predicted RNA binding protein YcfA (HicA-like mRNA interferase family)